MNNDFLYWTKVKIDSLIAQGWQFRGKKTENKWLIWLSRGIRNQIIEIDFEKGNVTSSKSNSKTAQQKFDKE